jgi:hypothetical protein
MLTSGDAVRRSIKTRQFSLSGVAVGVGQPQRSEDSFSSYYGPSNKRQHLPRASWPVDRTVRLLYLCPDYAPPSGSVRIIDRHVDLRRSGFNAFVDASGIGSRVVFSPVGRDMFAGATPRPTRGARHAGLFFTASRATRRPLTQADPEPVPTRQPNCYFKVITAYGSSPPRIE